MTWGRLFIVAMWCLCGLACYRLECDLHSKVHGKLGHAEHREAIGAGVFGPVGLILHEAKRFNYDLGSK